MNSPIQNATFWGLLTFDEFEDIHGESNGSSPKKKQHTKREVRRNLEEERRRRYHKARQLIEEQAMWGLIPCTVALMDVQPGTVMIC